MSSSDRERYELFIEHADHLEVVWNLKNADGFAICESNEFEDVQVMPFWSDEKQAQKVCTDDWSDYQPNPVDIDDFIDAWLHGMDEDGIYVGVNWDEDLQGAEVEPVILIEDLLGEE